MELSSLSIGELHEKLLRREIRVKDIVEDSLKSIEKKEDQINAFIEVFRDEALERARELDIILEEKKNLPLLFGIPIAIKDNINVKGHSTTCASRILLGYKSLYHATVVERLLNEGAVIIGKTNMDEFAMGATGEYSYFGPTRNPHNPEFSPGGSSSGSAAAVAAFEAVASLGSDTGGSIRLPAAYCGVVGLKPTYGRVSRYGLVAFASSLDQIGPIAKSVEDTARLFVTISGYDPMDSTSMNLEVPTIEELLSSEDVKFTLGIPDVLDEANIEESVGKKFDEVLRFFESEGLKIKRVSLPHIKYSVEVYHLIVTSEASSNLARYDGVRYGFREDADTLENMYIKTRSQGFGPEVKRRIMLGTFALSHGYYDAYYLRALRVRRLIKNDFLQAFKDVDIVILPVSPFPPPRIGETTDPVSLYFLDIFTSPANLTGFPAISLPSGRIEFNLPTGFQLIAPSFREDLLFKIATFYEKRHGFGLH